MGFFSWLTSDTKKSIKNMYTSKCRTVYLLQPNGAKPIKEPAYGGYGNFGGVNAYLWLARENLPKEHLCRFNDAQLSSAGIELDCGNLFQAPDGKLIKVFSGPTPLYEALGLDVECFEGRWDTPIPAYGKSANDMIENGEGKSVKISEIFDIRYPLKFSFDPDAKYEDLPAAENDPSQGFF